MQIAVLGATGMLGRHAAQAVLDAGHQLTVVYRHPNSLSRLTGLRFDARRADLNDRAALATAFEGLDGLIHAAAYYPTEPRPWRDDVAEATRLNENVFHAAAAARLQRVVYLGGAIALPRRSDGKLADGTEHYPERPANPNPYLQSKWAMDQQALEWARTGLPVVIGIPSMTFGEHDPGATTGRIVAGIASGQLRKYVRGQRNVVYAGDAGRGLVRALEAGVAGQRYLLTGANTDMDELVGIIARQAGVKQPRPVPLAMARVVGGLQTARWRWLRGPLPEISDTALAVMAAGQHLDGSRSKAIGYEPSVDLEETVARSLRWFKSQGLC